MEKRSVVTCIILTLITCGIYGIYWFIKLTDDSKQLAGDTGSASGGMAFLFTLVTCGIYSLFWAYKRGENIDQAKSMRGMQSGSNAIIYLLLCIFGLGIIAYALMQDEINKMIDNGN